MLQQAQRTNEQRQREIAKLGSEIPALEKKGEINNVQKCALMENLK